MARKKEQAFRTITEVSDWLDTPSHVLRFWESRFTQIKPVKRAGGRRYYRPEDLKIIGGIKYLLHDKGTTIAAVKDLFKSNGEQHIKEYSIEPIFPEKVSRKSKNIRKKYLIIFNQ
jgi:DNA-binding transcriptional MerR regulator